MQTDVVVFCCVVVLLSLIILWCAYDDAQYRHKKKIQEIRDIDTPIAHQIADTLEGKD